MSLGEIMLSEKTRITINIATLCSMVVFLVMGTWAVAHFESRVTTLERDVEENKMCIAEDRAIQLDNQIRLTSIETNTLWIMATLEEMK